ncbi:F-box protein [Acorus gramineus]|uniref:F-box protein n=1 Tax=Acorus gramineus TaxID=55184 RepID=A0AAV9BTW4_ACOGR|nr:F-box protein [Acorus gramineus]
MYVDQPLEEDAIDHFDRLPDPILVSIFNRLQDVKALGRCCAVSKRFHSAALQAESVVVRVDCVISGDSSPSTSSSSASEASTAAARGVFGSLVKLLLGTIFVKPIQALHQILLPKKVVLAEVSHHSPGEVLRNFREIRSLKIVLPGGELGFEDGALLKWRAEFGSSLEGCAILGATSFRRCGANSEAVADEAGDEEEQRFCTNGGLKLRVVWTITSLIAASARHFLLQQIVADHPTLRDLELTDVDGQGTLIMGREQLEELRRAPAEAASATANRTQVPALSMKLWYAPRLVLPTAGLVLEGATLVAIRPIGGHVGRLDGGDGFLVGAFDGAFGEAARAMVKRKTYLLEMNPF